jgi:DUF4097 and DUF4098 domain-containing protein YvlB
LCWLKSLMRKRMSTWRCTLNERIQILKLLEEGKINAEEAERLLEAVGKSSSGEKGTRQKIWTSIEGLPKVISAALGNSFSESAETEFHKYPGKKKVKFKGISGNLEIEGADTERIEIQKDGFAKIKEMDDSVAIKALSGNVKMTVPKMIDLEIAGISGDIDVTNIQGKLEIESVWLSERRNCLRRHRSRFHKSREYHTQVQERQHNPAAS